MQPAKLSIAELFQQREQYLIPLFQRGYVWTLTYQVQPLWEDIIDRVDALQEHRADTAKIGNADKLKPLRKHFFGAIIVGSPIGHDTQIVPTREVIDGQQRITTLQLMLLALRDVLKPHGDESLDDDVGALTYNKGKYAYTSKREQRTAASRRPRFGSNPVQAGAAVVILALAFSADQR